MRPVQSGAAVLGFIRRLMLLEYNFAGIKHLVLDRSLGILYQKIKIV